MNNFKRRIRVIVIYSLMILSIFYVTGCDDSATDSITASSLSVEYNEDDLDATWDSSTATAIQLNGTSISCDNSKVIVDGSTATISAAGTYVLAGTLTDGQIMVNTVDLDPVRIVLNGADITCSTSSAIYAAKVEKIILILAEDTENRVTDGTDYVFANRETDDPSAAIFCKGDLTINGAGTLTVDANYKEGITSKDELKIVSGNVSVDAVEDGIRGRDFVAIKDGVITVNAGSDGIKSNNDEDADKGFVLIQNGTIAIVAGEDGIQGENKVLIEDGNIKIISGGGSENGISYENNGSFGGGPAINNSSSNTSKDTTSTNNTASSINSINTITVASDSSATTTDTTSGSSLQQIEGGTAPRGEPTDGKTGTPPTGDPPSGDDGTMDPDTTIKSDTPNNDTDQSTDKTSTTTEDTSMKGIKAGTDVSIKGGTINIDSADDAIHSNDTLSITGGMIEITSGDDGIHADTSMVIDDSQLMIKKSYEGIESAAITINGGTISIISSDDGINVTGGNDSSSVNGRPGQNDFQSNGDNQLIINGGYLVIEATGDGLDSNGTIEMNDGTVIVNGPTSSGNGALDYGSSFNLNGGLLIVAGSSDMAETTSDTSTQNSVMIIFDAAMQAGTIVHIESESGEEILTFTPTKQYQTVVFSSTDLKEGETYLVYTGGDYDGTETDGVYNGGNYTGGIEYASFTVSGVVTKVGSTNTQGQMGGGGRQRGNTQTNDSQTTTTQ